MCNVYRHSKFFKNVGTSATNQNCIQKVDSRLNCGDPVENILSFDLLFNNVRNKTYNILISLVVLYGWETWSLIHREGCLRRLF
jgi:hypothetical protein